MTDQKTASPKPSLFARKGQAHQVNNADQELLVGLVNLTDVIADQAHDKYGVDCLLKPDTTG